MTLKNTHFVRCVRYLCGMSCGIETRMDIGLCGMCGINRSLSHAHVCAHVRMRAHARSRLHTAHTAHTAHANTHAGLRVFASRTTYPTHRTPKKMDGQLTTRVIRCTEENAREMQQVVRTWPALHDLVKDLQAQGQFPGLRALQIELTGRPDALTRGLGALIATNCSKTES